MKRLLVAMILVCTLSSKALAVRLCVQIDSGTGHGSLVVLKNVNLGAGRFGPVQGYLAYYTGGTYPWFYPLIGQEISATNHNLALGLIVPNVAVGLAFASDNSTSINLLCHPGADGKINVPDSCDASSFGSSATSHVVECSLAPPIP